MEGLFYKMNLLTDAIENSAEGKSPEEIRDAITKVEIVPLIISLILARRGQKIRPENLQVLRDEFSLSLNEDLLSTNTIKDLTNIEEKDMSSNLEDIVAFSLASNENNEKVLVVEEAIKNLTIALEELKSTYKADILITMIQVRELMTKVEHFTEDYTTGIKELPTP